RRERQPHMDERDADVDDNENEHRRRDLEGDAGDPPHGYAPSSLANRARAARKRSSTRSRPRTASDSNRGGPTVRPVTATRMGAWALASLSPCRSPIAWVTSWSTSPRHSHFSYSAMASSSTAAAGGFIAFCHDL